MKRISFILLICLLTLTFSMFAYGADLPIDITAIGRQEWTGSQFTTRIGANLFSADSQRVSETLDEQIQQRQDMMLNLFTTVPLDYEINPHVQVMNFAEDIALFASPVDFSNFNSPQSDENIPIWITILVLSACAVGGFVWATTSKAKKKGRRAGVH